MSGITILLPYLGRWDQFRKSRFHQISERLASSGHTIHVIQAPETDSDEVTFINREIDVSDRVILHDAELSDKIWNARVVNKVLQKGYYGIGVRKQVRNLIETKDIDLLWLYNLPHYPLARINKVPIVFDFVDDYIAMLNSELSVPTPEPIPTLERAMFGCLLRRTSLVTVISHELERDVKKMVGQSPPALIIPNGVDTDVFPIRSTSRTTPRDPPVVGFVGSFEYFIDFDLILDTAQLRPDIKFLLVGDGRELEYVRSQCKRRGLDNIELPGLVESSQVPEYINNMDICLNTFKRIPLAHSAVPLKLFEYLSQTRPVVSTRIREVQQIDEDFLYYADTEQELVAAIDGIIHNYSAAVRRTERAAGLIQSTYNWDTIGSQFEEAALSLVDP